MEEKEVLIVVDMQRDFIDGALGTAEAQEIVPRVREYIEHFKGRVLYTRDTHREDYLQTQEGRKLPVPHCLYGTHGWEITDALQDLRQDAVIDKPTFGSIELAEMLARENREQHYARITLIGVCTDVCVLSNAILLRAALPETEIVVDASCCAGVTPEKHRIALQAMAACQIHIENPPF